MSQCPYCTSELDIDFLNPIMDELAKNKMDGQVFIDAPCCKKPLRAFSFVMQYNLEPADGSKPPRMIGHA